MTIDDISETTLLQLKLKICEQDHFVSVHNLQNLMLNDKVLKENNITLDRHCITKQQNNLKFFTGNNWSIWFDINNSNDGESLYVWVKDMMNHYNLIKLMLNYTISDVKLAIHDKTGMSDKYKLYFNQRIWNSKDQTVKDTGLQAGSIIEMLFH